MTQEGALAKVTPPRGLRILVHSMLVDRVAGLNCLVAFRPPFLLWLYPESVSVSTCFGPMHCSLPLRVVAKTLSKNTRVGVIFSPIFTMRVYGPASSQRLLVYHDGIIRASL